MIDLSLEKKLIAFCGFYCRLCPFYTGEFRTKARDYRDFLAPMRNALSKICMEKNLDFEKFWEVLEFFSNLGAMRRMQDGWRMGRMSHKEVRSEEADRLLYSLSRLPMRRDAETGLYQILGDTQKEGYRCIH